jgi:small-conductance mechanosensitive channel
MVSAHPLPGQSQRAARPWGLTVAIGLVLLLGESGALAAQTPAATPPAQPPAGSVAAVLGAEPSGEVFTFRYANRPIVTLRARVLGRRPLERAEIAARILDELLAQRITGPIETRSIDGGALITVGSRVVIGVAEADIDELAGETVQGVTAQAAARLSQALEEASEARRPAELLLAVALAALGLAVAFLILWALARTRRVVSTKLVAVAERTLAKSGVAELSVLRASRLLDFQRGVVTAVITILQLFVVYTVITFVFQRFPYTRPWGESLIGFLWTTIRDLSLGMVTAVPGLITVAIIVLIARFSTRLVGLWFSSIERGRIHSRWIYPETAQPTRRLTTALVWVFAVIVAYPYLPGSQTDAFKGVSVFLGLMLTLGSSGLVNQIMSGFMVTYSRALRVGDYVRVGDVEGTVTHLGVLSTKLKTLQNEDVTIPNAVVASQTATDYSRLADEEGVFTATSVTIGYDAPWRQVHALLLQAAERTSGLRSKPAPRVYQTALEDFYVRYTLWVCLKRQEARLVTLDALHANIQDVFNEYGVQIMSPNYVFDPKAPKVVPKTDWFAAPARPDPRSTQD